MLSDNPGSLFLFDTINRFGSLISVGAFPIDGSLQGCGALRWHGSLLVYVAVRSYGSLRRVGTFYGNGSLLLDGSLK